MSTRRLAILASVIFFLASSVRAYADTNDTSKSPYFFVEGKAGTESLALSDTNADIHIAGVIADVVVTQTYKNEGKTPINARYVFPASTRAAVYGMKMTIGKRTIVAKIRKKAQARQEYEKAKSEGKSASLLEQDRPNVFTMNVANILPGDNIRVELRYTELVVPTDGVYEMVYPTVVGPRYVDPGADAATTGFASAPYTKEGVAPKYKLGIRAHIAAGMPVFGIKSPSHTIASHTGADQSASIDVTGDDVGNRDFILRYRLASDDIASGLMLYEGAKENYFLMMVQPPKRPTPEVIPAREYVFVVDVSGSMNGFPLEVTGKLMKELFTKLRPSDRFNVMLFAGGSSMLAETSLNATSENIGRAVSFIGTATGSGSTQLLPALQRALSLPADTERSRSFVVVTDGYISAETEAFDWVRGHLGKANVFAFGIGSSVNRHLIEGLAKAGLGEPFIATTEQEAPAIADKFRAYIESPVLTGIKVEYDGFSAYDQQPVSVPDVFANRPVVVFGKYKGSATGTALVTGVSGRGRFVHRFDLSKIRSSKNNSALRFLWARSRIADLGDFGMPSPEAEEEITQLGLRYSLLTQYTSFIAIDKVARNAAKAATDVDVPLPLPLGVSESAMGMTSGPEPALWWMLAWMLGFAALATRRRRRQEQGAPQ